MINHIKISLPEDTPQFLVNLFSIDKLKKIKSQFKSEVSVCLDGINSSEMKIYPDTEDVYSFITENVYEYYEDEDEDNEPVPSVYGLNIDFNSLYSEYKENLRTKAIMNS